MRDRLQALAAQSGASLRMNAVVTSVAPAGQRWRVAIANGEPEVADAVIVAAGGLSVPATGSDGTGLSIAAALGHTIRPTYAALTPLTASPAPFAVLAGISLPVTLTAGDRLRSAADVGPLKEFWSARLAALADLAEHEGSPR